MKRIVYDILREEFTRIVKENNLESEEVKIQATTLSPGEAIGNPEDKDYPLIIGRERLMQAEFHGCYGQAFTDMYGSFNDHLSRIIKMDLNNNFRRAIFISSLNAVMRYLGLIEGTRHCRDSEPRQCSNELVKYIEGKYAKSRIAMIGLQPRMVEALAPKFELKVTDMDTANIGTEKYGVVIQSPDETLANLEWCDIALVTGTTVTNETINQFMINKPTIFYGITIAGTAKLLGLNRWCFSGH